MYLVISQWCYIVRYTSATSGFIAAPDRVSILPIPSNAGIVAPEDIQRVASPVLRHRVLPNFASTFFPSQGPNRPSLSLLIESHPLPTGAGQLLHEGNNVVL